MQIDLLFYEAADGYAEFYSTHNGNLSFLRSLAGWSTKWTHIVDGGFSGVGVSRLLFYDSVTGTLRLCYVDAPGGDEMTPDGLLDVVVVEELPNWRPGCQLISGFFMGFPGGNPGSIALGFPQIMLYDPSTGKGDFYNIGGSKVELARSYSGWRTSWDRIIPGNFGGDARFDLLFYDACSSTGEFYAVANDEMSLLHSYTDWRNDWKQIVPGNFGAGQYTDLLFYDGMGTGQFWKVEDGQISLIRSYEEWRTSWTQIIPGAFTGSGFVAPWEATSDLLFYDGMGTGEFWAVEEGEITLLQSNTNWRDSWTQIVPGKFTQEITSPPVAFVSVTVEPFDPGSEYKQLRIIGSGFNSSESVVVNISFQDGAGAQIPIDPETTQADAGGHINMKYSGSGGGVCNAPGSPARQFWVKGTGVSSQRVSNTAHAGCSP